MSGMSILYLFDNKKESVASSVRCLVSLYTIILSQLVFKVNNFMVFRDDDQSLNSMLIIMEIILRPRERLIAIHLYA